MNACVIISLSLVCIVSFGSTVCQAAFNGSSVLGMCPFGQCWKRLFNGYVIIECTFTEDGKVF